MRNRLFIIVISFGLATYFFAIFFIPDFISDDYFIFTYISQHLQVPIALDPNSTFYLFTRPFSYLSFWIDYNLFQTDSVLMKVESLILFSISIIVMYYTLEALLKYHLSKVSYSLIGLGTLVYLFHPDSLMMNIWIANRTELLNILLYLISLLYFLKFFDKQDERFLIISFCSYLLCILSKQSGLHLPLILLIFYIITFKNHYKGNRKPINYYFAFLLIVFIIVTYFNILYGNETLGVSLQNYWKKPFSIFGISLLVVHPLIGELFYNYFLFNKVIALILVLLLFLIVLYFIQKHKNVIFKNNKPLFIFSLIYLISFYPRITGWGVPRINSIQIFWMIILILIFGSSYLSNFKLKIILLIVISSYIPNLFFNIINEKKSVAFTKERISDYLQLYNEDNSFVVTDPDIIILPYLSHYLRTGDFGEDTIFNSTIYYSSINSLDKNSNQKKVICRISSNSITVESIYDEIYLLIQNRAYLKDLKLSESSSGRGYGSVMFKIPSEASNKKLIYFEGDKWKEL